PTLISNSDPDDNSNRKTSPGVLTLKVAPSRKKRTRKSAPIKSNQSSLGSPILPLSTPCVSLGPDDQCTPITREADRHAYNVSKNMAFSSDELIFLSLARNLGIERAIVQAAKFHLKFLRPLLALLEGIETSGEGYNSSML